MPWCVNGRVKSEEEFSGSVRRWEKRIQTYGTAGSGGVDVEEVNHKLKLGKVETKDKRRSIWEKGETTNDEEGLKDK